MAEGATTAFGGIVGRFPSWIPQEHAQPAEVIHIQVVLLSAQRRDVRCLGVGLPGYVALLRFLWRPSCSQAIVPDREPVFEKRAGHAQQTTGGSGQQRVERLPFVGRQVLSSMKEQGALRPQVFSGTSNLVPIEPGERWRIHFRQEVGCGAQFGERGWVRWR